MSPDTIRKGQWAKEPAQQTYTSRVSRIARGKEDFRQWDTSKVPPGGFLYPTLKDLESWDSLFAEGNYDAISHDLETAGQFIICNGMTPLNIKTGALGMPLCLRFRGHGGQRWWHSRIEHDQAVDWLGGWLARADVAFVGHNVVGFDIPILQEHGYTVAGPIVDTMVLMSRLFPESKKGLQFCATLLLHAPVWKSMVKEVDDGDGKT